MEKRLVELIKHCTSCEECRDEDIAAHLIANGVFVPLCKPGDVLYYVFYDKNEEDGCKWIVGDGLVVTDVSLIGWYTSEFIEPDPWSRIGKDVFLKKEKAEKLANALNELDLIEKE